MRPHWLAVLILAPLLTSCGDDPSAPRGGSEESPWTEVDLGIVLGDTAELLSVDCEGGDCLASGLSFSSKNGDGQPEYEKNLFYELAEDGGFVPVAFPDLPEARYMDVALASSGGAVIVGYGLQGVSSVYSEIYDARTTPPSSISQSSHALFAVDGDGDFFVAGGLSGLGLLMSSQAPGSWNTDTFPTSGRNDGGFRDVHVRGDVAVACGFDDGADTLKVVLRRTKVESWKMLNRNGLPFGVQLLCIAVNDDGAIFLGGVEGPGSPGYKAFLSVRSPEGEWVSLVLPNAEELGGVNDILVARDGSVYLACSSEYQDTSTAHIVHATPSGVGEEISPFGGSLLQLAEGSDGTIYAAGSRRIGSTLDREPVLLKRVP